MESTRTVLFLTSPSAAHGTHTPLLQHLCLCITPYSGIVFHDFIHRFMSELLGMLKIPIVLIIVALGQVLM